MERDMKLKLKHQRNRHDEDSSKKSIMVSSLSREQTDALDYRFKNDIKGPGHYNPKLLFGKKVA